MGYYDYECPTGSTDCKFGYGAMEDLQQTESLVKFPDLKKISTLGTGGVHVNNMSRDISKYIDSIGSLPPTSAVEIPTNQGDAKTGILLPHEIFSFLFENYPNAFNKLFMPGGETECEKGWRQCSGASCLHGQPALRKLETKKAVQASTGTRWSWQSVVQNGSCP